MMGFFVKPSYSDGRAAKWNYRKELFQVCNKRQLIWPS